MNSLTYISYKDFLPSIFLNFFLKSNTQDLRISFIIFYHIHENDNLSRTINFNGRIQSSFKLIRIQLREANIFHSERRRNFYCIQSFMDEFSFPFLPQCSMCMHKSEFLHQAFALLLIHLSYLMGDCSNNQINFS